MKAKHFKSAIISIVRQNREKSPAPDHIHGVFIGARFDWERFCYSHKNPKIISVGLDRQRSILSDDGSIYWDYRRAITPYERGNRWNSIVIDPEIELSPFAADILLASCVDCIDVDFVDDDWRIEYDFRLAAKENQRKKSIYRCF